MSTSAERVEKVLSTWTSEQTQPDTHLDDLDLDSLDRVELVMELEDEFGQEISDDAAQNWVTVKDIINTMDRT